MLLKFQLYSSIFCNDKVTSDCEHKTRRIYIEDESLQTQVGFGPIFDEALHRAPAG